MAAVLASLPKPPPTTPSPLLPSLRPIPRYPTPSPRTRTGFSRSIYASPGDWPFEQRMRESLAVLGLMQSQSIRPDPALFCSLLKSCSETENLDFGKIIHDRIVQCGIQHEPIVANSLISLYAKCGHLGTARQLFEEMPAKSVVSWTTIISSYHHAGFSHDALDIYRQMRMDAQVKPNAFTYAVALSSCARVGNLEMGIKVHEDVVRDGCETDDFIAVALIDMYAKSGNINNACKVFEKLTKPTVAACTAMIEGFNANGKGKEAMGVFRRVTGSCESRTIDRSSAQRVVLSGLLELRSVGGLGFSAIVKSCSMEMALGQGQEIHAHIIKFGYKPGMKTISNLVELYLECNRMASARRLFEGLVVKKPSLWGRMGLGYVKNGLYGEAFKVYSQMVSLDAGMNHFITVSWALEACVGMKGLEEGKQIHGRLIKDYNAVRKEEDSVVAGLIELYEKCGQHIEAHKLMKHHGRKQVIATVDGYVKGGIVH